MLNYTRKANKVIATITIIMTLAITMVPMIVLATQDKTAPTITPEQPAGEVKAGTELKFTITDDSYIAYVYYAWDRRTDGGKQNIVTVDELTNKYEFTIKAPTEPGTYEFSIAAHDYNDNRTNWVNIPYVVTENPTGKVDTTKPVFVLNTPTEYPYNNSTIQQEMPITIRAKDDSGMYYIAYKWVRNLDKVTFATDTTVVYKTDEVHINAPTETGDWYLQFYGRDAANNLSSVYYTKVTVADVTSPTLTLNGQAEVEIPLNSTYDDPGATFSDNYDETRIVYSNETLDTSKIGPQTLTYTATDKAGNVSNTVSRTVTVVGQEKTYELTAPTKTQYNVNEPIDLSRSKHQGN